MINRKVKTWEKFDNQYNFHVPDWLHITSQKKTYISPTGEFHNWEKKFWGKIKYKQGEYFRSLK